MRKLVGLLQAVLFVSGLALSALAVLLAVCPCATLHADVTLVQGGQPQAVVVLSADASPSEEWAADELIDYIEQMSGATLTLQVEGGTLPSPAVLIGDGDAVESLEVTVDHEALGDDGFLIKTVGQRVVIAGGRKRGTMYGVFTLLDSLGVRWWTRSETYVPTETTVVVPTTDTTKVPLLEYRDLMYRETQDDAGRKWMARNRLNGMTWKSAPAEWGGSYNFGAGGLGHTMKYLLNKHGIPITTAMKAIDGNGQRNSGMLCLTAQATIDGMIEAVIAEYGVCPDAKFIHVGQEDGDLYCHCAACQAIASQEGSQSGPVIHFINEVAEGVELEVPNAALSTFAYNWSRTPPQYLTPNDNVYVVLCSYECGFGHPFSTYASYNESFKDDIEDWDAITTKLFIWDYATNFLHYLMPFPNLDVLTPNALYYANNGVKGIMEQGPWDGWAPEFYALRQWVFSRALWDPTADNEDLITEFLEGYYGPAAEEVQDYIDVMEEYARDHVSMQVGIYRNMNTPDIAPAFVAEEEEALQAAEAAVDGMGDPLERRVRHAHMPVWYLLAKRGPGSPAWRATETLVGSLDIAHIASEMALLESGYGINRVAEGQSSAKFFDWFADYAAQTVTYGVPKPPELEEDDLTTTRLLQGCQMERGAAWYVAATGASDGWAVKPPKGKQTLHYLSDTNDYVPNTKYEAYVRVRGCDVNAQATGTLYRCGVKWAVSLDLSAQDLSDEQWHTFYIGDVTPSGVGYDFWSEVPTSTGSDISAVEVDCFWIQLPEVAPGEEPTAVASVESNWVEDTDGDSKATIELDGSDSYDTEGPNPGIAEWRWFEGEYDLGTGVTLDVAFTLGEHTVTLQVTDNDDNVSEVDDVVFTVAPPADDDSVQFDLSDAYNYDVYISIAEKEHALLYNPPGDWSLANRKVSTVFGEHDLVPKASPVWEGQADHGVGIPAIGLISTDWGVFAVPIDIDSSEIPEEALSKPDSPNGQLPLEYNGIRACDGATGGVQVRSVSLEEGDCGQYDNINFIMTGNGYFSSGLTRLYANYEGEGTGVNGTLIWESPGVGDPVKYGVPLMTTDTSNDADIVAALSADEIWGGSSYSAVSSGTSTLWTFDEGLDLDPEKTLVGFTAQTTNNLHRLFIYAVSAIPATSPKPTHGTVDALPDAIPDNDAEYTSVVTIELADASEEPASGYEDDVTVEKSDGTGSVSIGDVTEPNPTGNPGVYEVEITGTDAGDVELSVYVFKGEGDEALIGTADITVVPTTPTQGTVDAVPDTIIDDEEDECVVTIELADALDRPASGYEDDVTVEKSAGDGGVSIGDVTEPNPTGNPGVYEVEVTGTDAGDVELSVYVFKGGADEALIGTDDITVTSPKPTQGTVAAAPDIIPEDGVYSSIVTIELADASEAPASGYAADVTVEQSDGTGDVSIGSVTEPDPTGDPGVYEVEVTGTDAGDVELSVYVFKGGGDQALIGTDDITVFTPGSNDCPLADAGDDVQDEDTDGDSGEEVSLDASDSYDATGITEYKWTEGSTVVYQGNQSVVAVDFLLGVHELVLTVTDGDGIYHIDSMTVTVAAPDNDSVQFDLSDAYNYDAYISVAEAEHALLYNPPGDWSLGNRKVSTVFGEHDIVPKYCPVWEGQGNHAVGIPACGLINTTWGTFALSTDLDSSEIPAEALSKPNSPNGQLPLEYNGVRACDGATGGTQVRSVSLATGDCGQYYNINFIMTGNGLQNGLIKLYANYEGEGEGTSGTLIWESPPIGDPVKYGLPLMNASTWSDPDIVAALSANQIWGGSSYSTVSSGTSTLWTFDEGLDLDPEKTLVGFTAQTTSNFQRLFIFAVSAMPATDKPTQGTVDALPDAIPDNDEEYTSVVTIELADVTDEPSSGYAADVTVEKSDGTGNVSIGDVTEPNPTGNPGVYEVEVTGTLAGDVELSVYVFKGEADEVLIGTDDITVVPTTPTQGTVDAVPDSITDDGVFSSIVTIELADALDRPASGYEDDVTVEKSDGTGDVSIDDVTEPDPTGNPGVYEVEVIGTDAGDVELSVYVFKGEADEALIGTDDIMVTAVKPTQGTVEAAPDIIPEDGVYSSIVTIELATADEEPASGYAAHVTVEQSDGTGDVSIGSVTEPDPTGDPGVYEVEVTGTDAGDVELSVYVFKGEVDEALIDTDDITVFTPGANDCPLADAGDDVQDKDSDSDGEEEITLDASDSYDATGITEYKWMEGSTVIYQGNQSVVAVDFLVGVHELVLTVTDGDGIYHMDSMTVTVAASDDDLDVQLDISSYYNFDGYISTAENDHAMLYDPPGDWSLANRKVSTVFGQHELWPYACPIWDGQGSEGVGIPEDGIITTTWGKFALSTDLDKNVPAQALSKPDSPNGTLEMQPNWLRVGGPGTSGETVPVLLEQDQCGQYTSLNFILVGNNHYGGIVRLYANYEGEGEGASGTLLWEAPEISGTQTGVPRIDTTSHNNPDFAAALSATQRWGITGSGTSARCLVQNNDSTLWTFDEGLDLNPQKTLVGFTAQTTTLFARLFILAASATRQPPKPTQGTVDADPEAIPSDGEDPCVLTIELANAADGPASGYADDVTVEKSDGTGSVSIGDVTEPNPTGDPGVYEVEITGTGAGDVELSVYVFKGEGDEALIGTADIIVFTPGTPLADAGDDIEDEDTDGDSKETIELDGSDSYDTGGTNPGIAEYRWFEGDYDLGTGVTLEVAFTIGEHTVTLRVTDNDSNISTDEVTVSVSPPASDDSVQFDLSDAWNYDVYTSVDEAEHALLYNPPGDWSLANRRVSTVFGEHDLVPKASPVWEGQADHGVGIPACGLIHTSWGTFALSTDIDSSEIPAEALSKPNSPNGQLPLEYNGIRACDGASGGVQVRSVSLAVGDRGQYESINFIMTGNGLQNGLIKLYANYQGEGEGTSGTLIWESPEIGDPVKYGLPLMTADTWSGDSDIVAALSADEIWGTVGNYTTVKSGTSTLWTFDEGLDLNSNKTLVGFTAQTTSVFQRLFIYAVSAKP